MLKGYISVALSLVIIVAVVIMFKLDQPDVSQYLYLKNPALQVLPPQKVIVVEAKGAPSRISKTAFGLLFREYFSIKGVPKGKGMEAPRARWPQAATVPESEWVGKYAMPVPDSITTLKPIKTPPGITMNLTIWEYGDVAEILHVGRYDKEEPTIQKLHDFIARNGYRIIGDHEEVYLRGPKPIFRGNPKNYFTIIRYRVEKNQ